MNLGASIIVQFQSSISHRRRGKIEVKSISMPISFIIISQGVRAFASCNSIAATSRPACIQDSDWMHYLRTHSLALARSVMSVLKSLRAFCIKGKITIHQQRRIGDSSLTLRESWLMMPYSGTSAPVARFCDLCSFPASTISIFCPSTKFKFLTVPQRRKQN